MGTGINQKDKDPVGSYHGDIHINVTLWYSHAVGALLPTTLLLNPNHAKSISFLLRLDKEWV